MHITHLDHGPYLQALGWTDRLTHQACSASTTSWAQLQSPVRFTDSGSYRHHPFSENAEVQPTALPPATLRGSGVARARSASQATVFAAILGKQLLQALGQPQSRNGERIGVAVASSSAITPIAWEFETTGLAKGWNKTDTMLLPSSIPSAIATQTSAVFDTHAAAIAFQDGAFGLCAAFEYAHLAFHHGRADHFLLLAAEEISALQHQALLALGDSRPRLDGASGLLLGRTPASDVDWQLQMLGNVPEGAVAELGSPWSGATTQVVDIPGRASVFSAPVIPHALHHLLARTGHRAVLVCRLPGRGRYFLGFSRAAAVHHG